jgi:hypothetical protein
VSAARFCTANSVPGDGALDVSVLDVEEGGRYG